MREKMEQVNKFFGEHAFLAAIVISAMIMLVRTGVAAMLMELPTVQNDIGIHSFAVVFVYYIIPLAFAFGLAYEWIFCKGRFFRTFGMALPIMIYSCFVLMVCLGRVFAMENTVSFLNEAHVVDGILYIVGIGFCEEVIFRGIIANKLGRKYGRDSRGVWKAVILSSVIFGMMHMMNLFHGVGFIPALTQSVVAFFTGMMLTAIYYRCGNIWAMILIHAFIDFGPLFASAFTTAGETQAGVINRLNPSSMILAVPMILITVWLLRKSRMEELVENLQNRYPRIKKIRHRRNTFKEKIDKIRNGNSNGLLLQL